MALSREELSQYYLVLHNDYVALLEQQLALELVTMATISMMPLEVRQKIIALAAPDHIEAPSLRQAIHELFDDMRGEPITPGKQDRLTDVVL